MTKNKSNLLVYLITGLSALLAVVLVYYYLNSRIAEERRALSKQYPAQANGVAQTKVVVANRDLASGTVIAPEDVRLAEVNPGSVRDAAVITDLAAIVGKTTRQPMYAGEWILTPKLEDAGSGGNFSAALENGHRAIRVTVTAASGLLGLIEPSDRVDVIGIFPLADGQASRTILQNVAVLAVGARNPDRTPTGKDGGAAKSEPDSAASAATVTLDVSTNEAERLALAIQAGKIQLVLRNRADQMDNATSLIQIASLANVPRPVSAGTGPAAAPGRTVTVVLGDKIESEVLKK